MEGTASLEEWGALARGPGRREGPGFAAGPGRSSGLQTRVPGAPWRSQRPARHGVRRAEPGREPRWSWARLPGAGKVTVGTGPLSCMASLSAQLAMWEGAGPEAGRAARGPPGRRPQSAVSSGVSAQRGLSLGGRWRPRRHGPVPGVWEEGLEPERVSLRRAALLRPLLTSRVGLWVRVTGAVLPPGPGSGRPPGPLRRLSLPGPAPLASGPLFPRPQDPDVVLSDWIAFFSGPETAAQGPAVPSRGLPLRPCPGGRLSAAQLCPRRAWRHSAASAGHSGPELLRTFRGQVWGAEALACTAQTCAEKRGAGEGGRRRPPACAPV